MKGINEYFEKSIGGEREDFIKFIKINHPDTLSEGYINDIDWLAHRVAQNMYYFECNIATAKSDYIALLALLMKKGVIFEKYLNK